jgi:hypothetical protein
MVFLEMGAGRPYPASALPGLGPTRPEAQTIRPAFRPFGRLPPRPDRAG